MLRQLEQLLMRDEYSMSIDEIGKNRSTETPLDLGQQGRSITRRSSLSEILSDWSQPETAIKTTTTTTTTTTTINPPVSDRSEPVDSTVVVTSATIATAAVVDPPKTSPGATPSATPVKQRSVIVLDTPAGVENILPADRIDSTTRAIESPKDRRRSSNTREPKVSGPLGKKLDKVSSSPRRSIIIFRVKQEGEGGGDEEETVISDISESTDGSDMTDESDDDCDDDEDNEEDEGMAAIVALSFDMVESIPTSFDHDNDDSTAGYTNTLYDDHLKRQLSELGRSVTNALEKSQTVFSLAFRQSATSVYNCVAAPAEQTTPCGAGMNRVGSVGQQPGQQQGYSYGCVQNGVAVNSSATAVAWVGPSVFDRDTTNPTQITRRTVRSRKTFGTQAARARRKLTDVEKAAARAKRAAEAVVTVSAAAAAPSSPMRNLSEEVETVKVISPPSNNKKNQTKHNPKSPQGGGGGGGGGGMGTAVYKGGKGRRFLRWGRHHSSD